MTKRTATATVTKTRTILPKTLEEVVEALRQDDALASRFFTDPSIDLVAIGPRKASSCTTHRVSWGKNTVCGVPYGDTPLTKYSIDELLASNRCQKCWGPNAAKQMFTKSLSGIRSLGVGLLPAAYWVWNTKRRLADHLARLASDKPPTTQATTTLLSSTGFPSLYYITPLTAKNAELIEYQRSLTELADKVRKATRTNDTQISELEAKIRQECTPSWWGGAPRTFDDTPTLLAISPLPWIPKKFVAATTAMRVYAITDREQSVTPAGYRARSGKLVLRAPRYVADFLIGRIGVNSSYVQSLDAPPDERVIEMACSLWTPDQPGDLQDFLRAIDVARDLIAAS
jgi:hypothetical protein